MALSVEATSCRLPTRARPAAGQCPAAAGQCPAAAG